MLPNQQNRLRTILGDLRLAIDVLNDDPDNRVYISRLHHGAAMLEAIIETDTEAEFSKMVDELHWKKFPYPGAE